MTIFGRRKAAGTSASGAEQKAAQAAPSAEAKAAPDAGAGKPEPSKKERKASAKAERDRAKAEKRGRQTTPAPASKRKAKKAVKAAGAEKPYGSANQLVGLEALYKDGLAESAPGVFSDTLEFSDISYEHERDDVQADIFNRWHDLLQMFPAGSCVQVNLLNIPKRDDATERIFREQGPTSEFARAYNDIIEERQRAGRTEYARRNLLTYAVTASNDTDAARQLSAFGNHATAILGRLRSRAERLNGTERAHIIHMLVNGPHAKSYFSYEDLAKKGPNKRVADYLSPAWFGYAASCRNSRDTLMLPGIYARTYHIKGFGSDLSDEAIRTIRALPIPMNISLIYRPQNTSKMLATINQNIAAVHAEMYDIEQKASNAGGSPLHLPPAIQNREADAVELLDFIREDDQHISYFQGTITVYGGTEEELEVYDKMLAAERERYTLDIVRLPLDQERALTTSLPLATPRLADKYRSLATAEAAMMIPFASQNITDDPRSSYFLGVDTVSGELITVDPDKTKSPHMWIFGFTGAGKGMQVNSILEALVLLHPKDTWDSDKGAYICSDERAPQIHVIDFHSEYAAHAKELGAAVGVFGAGQPGCINLMDMADEKGGLTRRTIAQSAEFFIALMASVMGRELSVKEITMIDAAIHEMYEPYIGTDGRPCLRDFHRALAASEKREARDLAEGLEVFVNGSFNSFAGTTNIEVDDQYNVYDCSEVGPQMQTMAMLAILQHVKKCTYANHRAHRPTYLFVEEVQIMFANDALIKVLDSFFGELRKYGLHVVCITQLPERVLEHRQARNLFQNSSIFVFLPQQSLNADLLAKEFALSADQRDRILPGAQAGTGLVIADGVTISMSNRIPKDSLLYEKWNTDPYAERTPVEEEPPASADGRIADLPIPRSCAERFSQAGIVYVSEVAGKTEAELTDLPGIGPKSARELISAIKNMEEE